MLANLPQSLFVPEDYSELNNQTQDCNPRRSKTPQNQPSPTPKQRTPERSKVGGKRKERKPRNAGRVNTKKNRKPVSPETTSPESPDDDESEDDEAFGDVSREVERHTRVMFTMYFREENAHAVIGRVINTDDWPLAAYWKLRKRISTNSYNWKSVGYKTTMVSLQSLALAKDY